MASVNLDARDQDAGPASEQGQAQVKAETNILVNARATAEIMTGSITSTAAAPLAHANSLVIRRCLGHLLT